MNTRRGKKIVGSLTLVIVSLTISLVLAELVVRALAQQAFHPGRRLFLSNPQFHVTETGAVRYLPSEQIRMVAVYEDSIEFDVTFATNNQGFIDSEDYPLNTKEGSTAYAIIGDSFVAGIHGGQPWVPELRSITGGSGSSRTIYNLGVEGTGFRHFSKLLEDVEVDLTFDAIVIVALSDDFRRPFWTPILEDSAVHMCTVDESREDCLGREPYASLFDESVAPGGIVELARQTTGTALLFTDPGRYLELQAKRSLFLVMLVRGIKSFSGGRHSPSFEAFNELVARQEGRDIYLLHMPQKHEVTNSRYDVDPRGEADALGVTYIPLLNACDWTDDMFYERDAHPNQHGYRNLGLCVARVLGWL